MDWMMCTACWRDTDLIKPSEQCHKWWNLEHKSLSDFVILEVVFMLQAPPQPKWTENIRILSRKWMNEHWASQLEIWWLINKSGEKSLSFESRNGEMSKWNSWIIKSLFDLNKKLKRKETPIDQHRIRGLMTQLRTLSDSEIIKRQKQCRNSCLIDVMWRENERRFGRELLELYRIARDSYRIEWYLDR